MQKTKFYKYHGTGNDFILVDNRQMQLPRQNALLYSTWCNRRFGIGADGVILLQNHTQGDFEMVYYNADGNEGSMCGNGGRCVVAFAHQLGIIQQHTHFWAADGWHKASIDANSQHVSLKMNDVKQLTNHHNAYILDTGSPHYVAIVPSLAEINVTEQGKKIRYSPTFADKGINVNFIETYQPNRFLIATYERGVEDETYSCGTGTVAAAIVVALQTPTVNKPHLYAKTKGGDLQVSFEIPNDVNSQYIATNIWLHGSATRVFEGEIVV